MMPPPPANGIDPHFYVLLQRTEVISAEMDRLKASLNSGDLREFKRLLDEKTRIANEMAAMLTETAEI